MSTNHSDIRLLTVDAAGTLVRPWPSVGAVYGRTAREHGIDASDEEVNTRFYQTFGKLQTCKKTNGGEESEFWRQVVTETFRPFARLLETGRACPFLPHHPAGTGLPAGCTFQQ